MRRNDCRGMRSKKRKQVLTETELTISNRNDKHSQRKEVITMNRNDQEFMVQKIRSEYTEKEHTQLDELKALDAKVKRPANVFAYVFGSISAIVMGSGMSLVMTEIGSSIGVQNPLVPGIIIGVIGMIMAIVNYPIYKGILSSRKKKYGEEILKLSEKLMQ